MDDQLHERMAFMGSLASGLAHEIKNPLSTMTITLGLMHEAFENPETRRDERTLRKIELLEAEVSRLEHILADFLKFAGGHVVQPALVNVNGWLGELLDFYEPNCADAVITLERRLGDDLPQVLVDRELMKQALLNLLTNARQALDAGGTLSVRTWSPGDSVHIEVEDDGPGIHPADLARIWQVYFSTKPTGTGLGLPTVRRIIAEHGGQVTVRSEVGVGTRFSVVLPLPPAITGKEPLRLPGSGAQAGDVTRVLVPEPQTETNTRADSRVPRNEGE